MKDLRTDAGLAQTARPAYFAGALIQAVLGTQFVLTGLSKWADQDYVNHFEAFLRNSPGAHHGIVSPIIQTLVLPHVALAAQLARFTELGAGLVLLVAAAEIVRRGVAGRIGARCHYEPALALMGAAAGLAIAGLSMTIYLIQGGVLPGVNPARAFAAAIAVELLMVPVGLGIAWMEFGRYVAMSGRFVPNKVRRLVA